MRNREEVAKLVAQRHYLLVPAITEIRTLSCGTIPETSPNEPIKLLEVNANTIASGIMPLKFDAALASGIDFPCVIVEITPEEYESVKRNELPLPNGWVLGPLLPRPGISNFGTACKATRLCHRVRSSTFCRWLVKNSSTLIEPLSS